MIKILIVAAIAGVLTGFLIERLTGESPWEHINSLFYDPKDDPWHVPEGEFCDYCLGSQMMMRWCFEKEVKGNWEDCKAAYQSPKNADK